MRKATSLLFLIGLAFLLTVIAAQIDFGHAPLIVGKGINAAAPTKVGSANIVAAVVLAYRGIDTLGELAILFTAATAGGMVLGLRNADAAPDPEAGFILRTAADLLFPVLLVVGLFIVFHGHLTPGGGFQGGVVLAAAFFLPLLAHPGSTMNHPVLGLVEGLAGGAFIVIGLFGLLDQGEFLRPLLDKGALGTLWSAGTLPLLYLAVGLKVGSELASLLAHISEYEVLD